MKIPTSVHGRNSCLCAFSVSVDTERCPSHHNKASIVMPPSRLPQWRYNLYCMIHGKSRDEALAQLEWMVNHCGLQSLPHEVLFSRRRFKQRGAVYSNHEDR